MDENGAASENASSHLRPPQLDNTGSGGTYRLPRRALPGEISCGSGTPGAKSVARHRDCHDPRSLLLRLHPITSVPCLVQRLKGGSSVLATRDGHCTGEKALRWEKGYNIQSVSEPALKRVAKYVEAQPFRHPDEAIAGWYPTRFGSEVASATGAEWRL